MREKLAAIELPRESSPVGHMAKQTKPFIVEIKQPRKLKPSASKPSIWGKLDLSSPEDLAPADTLAEPATAKRGDQP